MVTNLDDFLISLNMINMELECRKKLDYEKILPELDFEILSSIGKNTDKIKLKCRRNHTHEITPLNIRIKLKSNIDICIYCEKDKRNQIEFKSMSPRKQTIKILQRN